MSEKEPIKPEKFDISIAVKESILGVLFQIEKGFRRVMLMYTIAFYLGIGLIIFSVIATVLYGTDAYMLLFGGAGMADIVAFFVFKPTEDLQRSRGNLAQLTSGFIAWYNDLHNWNHAVEREFYNEDDTPIKKVNLETLKEISKRSILNTVTIMIAIECFVAKGGKDTEKALENITNVMKNFEERFKDM